MKKIKKQIIRIADDKDADVLIELNKLSNKRYGYDYTSINCTKLQKIMIKSLYESK